MITRKDWLDSHKLFTLSVNLKLFNRWWIFDGSAGSGRGTQIPCSKYFGNGSVGDCLSAFIILKSLMAAVVV
jgi:hypothetical protein